MKVNAAPGGRVAVALVVLALVAGALTTSNRSRSSDVLAAPAGLVAPVSCGLAAPASTTAAVVPEYQAVVAQATTLSHDGAALAVGDGATAGPVPIGITPLTTAELPPLDAGMANVTQGPRQGYRFTPHPFRFQRAVEVSIPYDPARVGVAFSAQDVHTYYFDEPTGCWRPLERVRVDEKKHVVVSRTDHFTDMVNAVVTVPEHPENTSFNPTQIKDLESANPGTGVTLVGAPGASHTGDAQLSYPIEVPPGRGGLQPRLGVTYNSASGNSWLGLGWDLPVPSITVDTRWGVPRYDGGLETETYLFGGQQLTPVAHRGALRARSAEKVFHTRIEGGFARITRHGSAPKNYTWEVVDKAGTRSLFGGAPASTLTDDAGNVFQWALRELRDPHGNVMRYHTVRQDDAGVDGGSVPGRNLYLRKITYTGDADTEGPYAVTFIRDRELEEPRRTDVTIDARGGFKRVTADLLRRIEVTLDNLPIRQYELDYTTGAFGKTLLSAVTQFDENGQRFASHTFGYHDDIRDGSGAYQAFEQVGWDSPDDDLGNDAVGGVSGGAGEAGALNSSTSTSAGGHLYVGAGPVRTKTGSVGVKAGFSSAEQSGLLALADVDGDNLPDKVFRGAGGMVYRKNLARPGGQARFSDQVTPLRQLPGILRENSETVTVGVESYVGAAAQLNHVDTFTTTDRYLSDVNGDGITDLVNGEAVLFGRIGADGAPVYGVSGDTPVPIGAVPVDAGELLADFTADRERQIDSHPLVDTVRRWVAPFDGTVRVSGDVRLVEDTGAERAAYSKADGVRVAIQREAGELWSRQIGATDYAAHPPSGVDAVTVKRGERLYFRVQSNADGAYDRVAWDPRVTYTGVPADTADVNGLNPYDYQASRDFTLGGRASAVAAPAAGTVHLSGALSTTAALTDDITAVITVDGRTVFERTLPAGEVGEIPVDRDVEVKQGQQIQWRVRVDSPVDLSKLAWTPTATFPADQVVQPPYEVDMYPADSLTAPQESYPAPADGTLIVAPALTIDDAALDARVVFTVKKRGALLAKKVIDVVDGQVPADSRLTVPVTAGDELFFDFSTPNAAQVRSAVEVGYDEALLSEAPSALRAAAAEGAFPQPYRGWGVVGYNGNRERAGRPIAQDALVMDNSYREQLPADVDPQRDKDEFAADPRITPPKVFPFTAAPAEQRWEASDHLWATKDTASGSRLGTPALTVPVAADFDEVTAVPRVSRSTQISLSGSVGDVISVGGSVASGDSVGELDYLDMNGDRFPDVVGAGGIQYTDPTGQLSGARSATPDRAVRETSTKAGNASAGSAARTITTGRGYAAPPAHTSSNTATCMPPSTCSPGRATRPARPAPSTTWRTCTSGRTNCNRPSTTPSSRCSCTGLPATAAAKRWPSTRSDGSTPASATTRAPSPTASRRSPCTRRAATGSGRRPPGTPSGTPITTSGSTARRSSATSAPSPCPVSSAAGTSRRTPSSTWATPTRPPATSPPPGPPGPARYLS